MALYKNWPAICEIGQMNNALMFVLASISTDENDPITQGLFVGFPQCFSTEKADGPFPLSIIRDLAEEAGRKNSRSNGAEYPGSNGVLDELGVPFKTFALDSEMASLYELPLAPSPLGAHSKQGDVGEWRGVKMIVLEKGGETMDLAPLECIVVDL